MTDREIKNYLAWNIGSQLKLDEVILNTRVYKEIFYNAINNNQCIIEYLKELGFKLIDEDKWRKVKYINKKEYIKRNSAVKREREKEFSNYIEVQRSHQYKANGNK